MSKEKRQTRLLPFRLRRATRVPGRAGDVEDLAADAELTALLRTWEAPPQDAGARSRLLAEFRTSVKRAPLWRRALTAQVRVPLPIAACMGLALLLSLYALGARARVPVATPAAPAESAVRIVEVPVIKERVVTNTVYVEKKERGAARVVSTRAGARESLAQREERAAETTRQQEPARSPESHAGYYTRVDMNDFQPTNEVKLRIVSRGGTDEK
ncbi:MAG: hypothetical protein ACJ74T_05455 [Pyrinomonadaceae bacterium]